MRRLLDTIMWVIFITSSLAVGGYWLNRIVRLPDANELATKADIRRVTAVVIDHSREESRKSEQIAVTDKRRHDDLMQKLHVAMIRQQENIKAIDSIRRRLRAEGR